MAMKKTSLPEVVAALRPRHGAALLAAGGVTEMASCRLDAADRAVFDDFHAAMRRWFQDAAVPCDLEAIREINAVYNDRFGPCLDLAFRYTKAGHPGRLACSGAYLQFYAILPLVPRGLPGDGFYDMGLKDFDDISTKCARGRASKAIVIRRFERLLAAADLPWAEQCDLADSIPWATQANESKLPLRLRAAAVHLAAGGDWRWRWLGGAALLEIDAKGGKISLRLDAEERASLAAFRPELAE
ncbi:MAG: hypothetical protein KC486_29945 [Myxococcales bacterium]|nr:hypothetical protein [Myxococcales bacterium]